MRGTVKMFDYVRGFGFVVTDAGANSVFFHKSQLTKDGIVEPPKQGERLMFDIEIGERGPRAINLARI